MVEISQRRRKIDVAKIVNKTIYFLLVIAGVFIGLLLSDYSVKANFGEDILAAFSPKKQQVLANQRKIKIIDQRKTVMNPVTLTEKKVLGEQIAVSAPAVFDAAVVGDSGRESSPVASFARAAPVADSSVSLQTESVAAGPGQTDLIAPILSSPAPVLPAPFLDIPIAIPSQTIIKPAPAAAVPVFYYTTGGGGGSGASPVFVDRIAPTVPILAIGNFSSKTSVLVQVTAVSNDGNSPPVIFDYQYATSGAWIAVTTDTVSATLTISGVRGDSYSFRARAADQVGNVSDWSAATTPTLIFVLDTTPPSPPILDASFNNLIYTSSTGWNIFGVNSTDTVRVVPYFSPASSSQPALLPILAIVSSSAWNLNLNLNAGYNYFYFTAHDEDNNTSTFSNAAVIISDNVAPAMPTVAVNNQSSKTSVNLAVTVSSTDDLSPPLTYWIQYRTSTEWIDLSSGGSNNVYNLFGIRGNSYSFRARAADQVGNVSDWSAATTPTLIFVLDTTPPSPPILDASFNNLIYTSSTVWNIFGANSTDTVRILPYFSPTSIGSPVLLPDIALSSSTAWNLNLNLNAGYNYFYFTAHDEDNNTSTFSNAAALVFDNNAPAVPNLTVANLSSMTSTRINLAVSSTDDFSPVVYYDVVYRTSTDWFGLADKDASTTFSLDGGRGDSYYFRARARDAAGNVSDWSADSAAALVRYSGEVVFNEIAWAGTSASYPKNEWLELYNPSDAAIDLTGWKIKVSGAVIDLSSKTIASKGYYLLEPNKNAVKNVAEDQKDYYLPPVDASGKHFGSNIGNKLELIKPNGEKVDEVDCSAGPWFAGTNSGSVYRTMEKIDPLKAGNDVSNWRSSPGTRLNGGLDAGNNKIFGSPRQANLGNVLLTGNVPDTTQTLTKLDNPYWLEGYTVPVGKTLNIEPGVIVKNSFIDAQLLVSGNLNINGTLAEPVTFTSAAAAPAAGDWRGFWFYPGSSSTLNYLNMSYAGRRFQVSGYVNQAIRAVGGALAISNSNFNDNGSVFIHLESNAAAVINDSAFNNGGRAIEAYDSALTVSNSSFAGFTNASGPIYSKNKWADLNNLSLTGNASNFAFFDVVVFNSAATIKSGAKIRANALTVNAGNTLTLEAGAEIYLESGGVLDIKGSLIANGAAAAPIIIQPYNPGNRWSYLNFTNSTSTLSYVNLTGGNLTGNGAVISTNSNLTLNNVNILDSRAPGSSLWSSNSVILLDTCTLGHTVKPATYTTYGVKVAGGSITFNNTILKNLTYGLFVSSAATITSTNMTAANLQNLTYTAEPASYASKLITP